MLSRILKLIFRTLRSECIYAFPANRPRAILFVHIPKCARSTLGNYLHRIRFAKTAYCTFIMKSLSTVVCCSTS